MKNFKKGMLLGLTVLCTALAGCGTRTADDAEVKAEAEKESGSSTESEKAEQEISRIQLSTMQGDSAGIVQAYDEKEQVVWRYETAEYEPTELPAVAEIGRYGGRYYLVEGGSVVAFNEKTGEVLWKNDEFQGSGTAAAFGSDSIYLCGYYGPDFYEISYDGETVKRIGQLNEQYYQAFEIEEEGNLVVVTLEGGSESGEPTEIEVNKETYECEVRS